MNKENSTIKVDDTEYIRTVIVNPDFAKDEFERY